MHMQEKALQRSSEQEKHKQQQHYDFCSPVIVISSVVSFHKAVLVNHR